MSRYFYPDFIVPHNEKRELVAENILCNLILNRIRDKRNTILLVKGESGSGKSTSVLTIIDKLCKKMQIETVGLIKNSLIYTPIDYQNTMEKYLYDKQFRKYNILWFDEAEILMDSTKWQSFINTSLAQQNAVNRAVKRMITFIVAPNPKMIDSRLRKSANFEIECTRAMMDKCRIKLYRYYFDERDMDNVKQKRARIKGYEKMPNGKYQVLSPVSFELDLPRKELFNIYDKVQWEKKGIILSNILKKLADEMRKQHGDYSRVQKLVEWATENPEELSKLVKRVRGKVRVMKDVQQRYDLSKDEVKFFEEEIKKALIKKGVSDGSVSVVQTN